MILHVLSLYMITGNWELLQYFTSIEYYWWHCFSPPQVLCLPLVTPPTLCLPWNYRPTSYRNTGSRGAWPCCVPSTTNCHPQRLWSVVHMWRFCTTCTITSVSGRWGMWVRRRWGTLPDNKDAHCGVPSSPVSCHVDPIMYIQEICDKNLMILHCKIFRPIFPHVYF